MRNTQAARYARWAGLSALLLAVIVGGVFLERQLRAAHAQKHAPPAVPATVQRQSGETAFSKVDGDRTIFTVRASHATEYKDQNRAVLDDVWITIYGRDGSRNDNIHTRECSYQPLSGDIRCQGDVQIDLQSAKKANVSPGATSPAEASAAKPASDSLQVNTRDLSYNHETGLASTSEPVSFTFPQGTGHGIGMRYNTNDATVTVDQSVEFDIAPSEKTGGLPVNATGSSLEIRRNDHTVVLHGPAVVRQGARELSADNITVLLDQAFQAKEALAEGHPAIHVADDKGKMDVTADKFEASLNPQGWVQSIVAEGNVAGVRQSAKGVDHFDAARVDIAMQPDHNLLKEMIASGGVAGDSQEGPDSRKIKTDSLRIVFSPVQNSGEGPEKQHIESAETLAPATIESNAGADGTELHAKKFVAAFDSDGHLTKLFGHSSVDVTSRPAGKAPQITSAAELAATFGAKSDWDTLDETGGVQFEQSDRHATAAHAHIDRASDTIAMDGSPVLSDSTSRTNVGSVKIHQKSGQMDATGSVISTYLPNEKGGEVNLGTGLAHISADSLTGSTTSGHVIYQGHARMWQGDSVLQADRIELWRDEKKLQATGHVVADFPQAASASQPAAGDAHPAGASTQSNAAIPPSGSSPVALRTQSQGPTLWEIHAPRLTYWDDESKAHLEGGVMATSQQGSMESRTLDAFFSRPDKANIGLASNSSKGSSGQLSRAIALGDVVVHQGGLRGTADRADYTSAEGKFVLSGGFPTIVDASGDTTTGHSLTFFVASDTILVDSDSSSRALTKHRVEK